jgi:transcriptional regulator with XRE-family HTH domain
MEVKMNQKLNEVKIAILTKYPTQSDFAEAVPMDETWVSRVLNGRRQISAKQAQRWQELLNCDPEILASVTK